MQRITLKLLIDTKCQRVLFAEAGKECVDFLFRILTLPVATLTGYLQTQNTAGSLVNLYESVEKLNPSYIQPNKKDSILKPVLPPVADGASSFPMVLFDPTALSPLSKITFYTCENSSSGEYHYYFSENQNAICPSCKTKLKTNLSYVAPPRADAQKAIRSSDKGGYVNGGVVTYMLMDDLSVMPMSAISSITLLKKFGISDVGVLEEKEVNLGNDRGVKLLNACLQSKTVLTDVFLKG